MAYSAAELVLLQTPSVDNTKQYVDILTPAFFGESLNNRKDSYDLKLRVYTGGDDLNVLVYKHDQDEPIQIGPVNTSQLEEVILDMSNIVGITKWWQIRLVGILADFKLDALTIDYTDRPEPVTYTIAPWVDAGPRKKRIRVWPVTVDSLGNEVSIVPYVDGVAQEALVETTSYPQTLLYQFTEDVFGIDYAISIHGCEVFELYKIHPPEGVQTLPIAKRFDQVGSIEFFRYGKIKSFVVRLIAFEASAAQSLDIPYTVFFEDNETETGVITCQTGKEDTFKVNVRKTTAGQIVRIEFGPTEFNFHRFYVHIQVAVAGQDTELEWIKVE